MIGNMMPQNRRSGCRNRVASALRKLTLALKGRTGKAVRPMQFLLRLRHAPTRNLLGEKQTPRQTVRLSKLCATLDSSRSLRMDRSHLSIFLYDAAAMASVARHVVPSTKRALSAAAQLMRTSPCR